MSGAKQKLGQWGEMEAAGYLAREGYSLLDRNARTPYGELDLVARQVLEDGCQVTVFVEVKTRTSGRFGYPEDAVTSRKQAHLLSAARAYLLAHPELEGPWRVDVIAIQRLDSRRPPAIVHFQNAVQG